jgi:hypothetical protein
MDQEALDHNARQLQRLLDCIIAARNGRLSLVQLANSLLFLRDALVNADEDWSSAFTSHAATLESAGLATDEQRAVMGEKFERVVSTALATLESLIHKYPTADLGQGEHMLFLENSYSQDHLYERVVPTRARPAAHLRLDDVHPFGDATLWLVRC